MTGYSDPTADAAIEAAERQLDPRKRGVLLRRVMTEAAAAHVSIPLPGAARVPRGAAGPRLDESASGRVRLEEIARAE